MKLILKKFVKLLIKIFHLDKKEDKINIYLDMDGVLSDFNAVPNAKYIFKTAPNFFYNLAAIQNNLEAVKELKRQFNFFIMTASPNVRCDHGKRRWIKRHLSCVKMSQVIITRLGESKAEHMITKTGILLDDYSKNVQDWINHGHVAYKVTEEHNVRFWLNIISQ